MNFHIHERARECFQNILMIVNEMKSFKFIENEIAEEKMQAVTIFTIVPAMVRDNQHSQTAWPLVYQKHLSLHLTGNSKTTPTTQHIEYQFFVQ